MICLVDKIAVEGGNVIASRVTNSGKGQCHYLRTNLDDPRSIKAMADAIREQYQVIDILIINSASKGTAIDDTDSPEMDHLDVSSAQMTGPLNIFKNCFPFMDKGIVINICPYEVMDESPSMAAASVKAGLVASQNQLLLMKYKLLHHRTNYY